MVTFIYQPKSGDRVFVENPTMGIVIVKWSNGCRHVVGGIRLTYEAARQGFHWRGVARNVARAIVKALGGIAWDTQGTVEMVVPVRQADRAEHLMQAASEGLYHPVQDLTNTARMLTEGYDLDAATFAPINAYLCPDQTTFTSYFSSLRPDPKREGEQLVVVHLNSGTEIASEVSSPWAIASVSLPEKPAPERATLY